MWQQLFLSSIPCQHSAKGGSTVVVAPQSWHSELVLHAVTTFASFVCPSIPSDKQTRLGKNVGIPTIRTIP
jgi:hypothetical protein